MACQVIRPVEPPAQSIVYSWTIDSYQWNRDKRGYFKPQSGLKNVNLRKGSIICVQTRLVSFH